MKILEDVNNIISKNEWKEINTEGHDNVYMLLKDNPEKQQEYEHPFKDDIYFLDKYQKYIMTGHYGFSLGSPIIPQWCDILDEILDLCVNMDSDFGIAQIKIKYGYVCFYTYSNVIEDLDDVEHIISNTLQDKALIY